jgi:hypothetical protein
MGQPYNKEPCTVVTEFEISLYIYYTYIQYSKQLIPCPVTGFGIHLLVPTSHPKSTNRTCPQRQTLMQIKIKNLKTQRNHECQKCHNAKETINHETPRCSILHTSD